MMVQKSAPLLLAGPIVRRVEKERFSLWLAMGELLDLRMEFSYTDDGHHHRQVYDLKPSSKSASDHFSIFQAGERLFYWMIDLRLEKSLPLAKTINYQLFFRSTNGFELLSDRYPDLLYPGKKALSFQVPGRIKQVLHGSCRNPNASAKDGLVFADQALSRAVSSASSDSYPSILLFSGDQIYADHVAGPVLYAIHQVTEQLGIYEEDLAIFDILGVGTSSDLHNLDTYYHRDHLLPTEAKKSLFFTGKRKPIFTSVYAENHLITLAEYLVMYLLVWSPSLWKTVDLRPKGLIGERLKRYQAELVSVVDFVKGLVSVQRLMAHIPVAMIFDDHDISDDWNLHRAWEENAYGHPVSNRIISNGMVAYLVNQGWGNNPEVFSSMETSIRAALSLPGHEAYVSLAKQLIKFENWGYTWKTEPKLIVLDTRTQRWRSEVSAYRPSGLMDWESLTDLQEHLKGLTSVILVSPAPVFGVKLIEAIQRVFTLIGKPLMVDAENWMAHPGSANGILNIFRHRRTPGIFTILSGDVHYSFVYDVRWRSEKGSPKIWQICSSGIKNTFPKKLLIYLDLMNRIFYASRSPLNWFTKRRNLRVSPRTPKGLPTGRRLLNQEGVGMIEFDQQGQPIKIEQLVSNTDRVEFLSTLDDSSTT